MFITDDGGRERGYIKRHNKESQSIGMFNMNIGNALNSRNIFAATSVFVNSIYELVKAFCCLMLLCER